MVTITDQRIRNTVFQNIYSLIDVSASTFNASSTPDVISGHVDLNTVTFPCIVINPIEVEEDSKDKTIDTTRVATNRNVVVIVEVYTKKAEDLDNIADGLNYTFSNNSINGIQYQSAMDSTGISFPNNSKIRQKTITLNFLRR